MVHDVAGTTVDPVDSLIELDGRIWRFVDTAGLRRKVGQASGHEFYASVRTHSAIDAAEVVVVLIDASEPLTEQDQRVLSMVIEAGRALVLAFNKWDLVDEDRRYLLDREIDLQVGPAAVGAAGEHLGQDRPCGAETGARDGDRAGVLGRPDLHRAAEHLAQGGRRGDPAAGARRQAAADSVRHPGHRRGRRRSCCSPAVSWRPATGVSWSAGCGRRSVSRARPIRINVRVREKRKLKPR